MCGIFGLAINKNSSLKSKTEKIAKDLFILSESRGKEASGFANLKDNTITYFKAPYSSSDLVKKEIFKKNFNKTSFSNKDFVSIGHSRLVTHGYEHDNNNNQPIVKDGICLVHNGIVTNYEDLWKNIQHSNQISNLDSEIIPSVLHEGKINNLSIKLSFKFLYESIIGMTSIAVFQKEFANFILATNNGSLYYVEGINNEGIIFASESLILKQIIKKHSLESSFSSKKVKQIAPRSILNYNLLSFTSEIDTILSDNNFSILERNPTPYNFLEIKDDTFVTSKQYINNSLEHDTENVPAEFLKFVNNRIIEINSLKRCTKCLLPESFPNIHFDDNGKCNICDNHINTTFLGTEALKKDIQYKSNSNGVHDCLIPFSGGRDSCYLLHFVKNELGLKPLAFSYDWGMITDLGRRNQARMCDKLGVEHIYISADIRKKRKNIYKNVSAWLKTPDLGTIPLFMAGDKHYFYYTYKLQKDYNLDLVIMGENKLEKTGFKTGFSGASQTNSGAMAYNIDTKNKLKMMKHYALTFLKNPSYINSSLIDTFSAFSSYYITPHNYLNLFDYINWDEKLINETLINNYSWETDPETTTTWRIGDGTAAFYNYIYYMVAGFTENDTFRSNQIREGLITRNDGLEKVKDENKIRWSSFQWYCKTIGINWLDAVNTINKIKPIFTNFIK